MNVLCAVRTGLLLFKLFLHLEIVCMQAALALCFALPPAGSFTGISEGRVGERGRVDVPDRLVATVEEGVVRDVPAGQPAYFAQDPAGNDIQYAFQLLFASQQRVLPYAPLEAATAKAAAQPYYHNQTTSSCRAVQQGPASPF